MHKNLEAIVARVWKFESENVTLRMELKDSSLAHPKAELGLAEDLGEALGDLEKENKERETLSSKVGNLEKVLAVLRS